MAVTLKLRQGLKSVLPTTGLTVGEPLFCTDSYELNIADTTTSYKPAVFDVSALGAIGTVATDDLIYMYDTSATTVKAKKITFDDFKTALNIPAGSSDELVACASGATAGYLGTDGTDGVLRAGAGIGFTAGGSNAYVTLDLYFASEAQGDIIYRGASDWARLAAGTSGGILSTLGAGGNPLWITTIDGGTF